MKNYQGEQMERKRIYNPDSEEKTSERRIFGGDPSGIFELNDIKYQWAYNLWEMMLNNTWFPKEVDMTRDVNDYKNLTDAEKAAYGQRVLTNGTNHQREPESLWF
jgi:ribonucleoside-diphosphate reductase beta chain